MKNVYLILILSFAIVSCKNKNMNYAEGNSNASSDFSNSVLRDTLYLKNDSAIVPEYLYLNLDSIKNGDPFTDKADLYGYYRLLFSSSEETHSFHIEKIKIVGDGIVKLERRFKIPPEVFGLDYDFPNIDFIKWLSPEIIEINVSGIKMKLDISKMEAEKI